ncbi:solute carrier family 22 member 6-like [Haemaphysalis longicornis]
MDATDATVLRTIPVAEDASQDHRHPSSNELPFGDGLFQLLVVFSAAIGSCSFLLQHRSFKITFAVMDHWCQRPESFANVSVEEWVWLATPLDDENKHKPCFVRDPPDGGYKSRVVPCSSWEFDMAPYGQNAVSEWNLVCDRAWQLSVVSVVYCAMCITALMVAGIAADHVGRRTVVILTIPVVIISGAASGIPEGFSFFVAVRSIVSAGTCALVPPLFVLLYEVSPTHKFTFYVALVSLACIVMTARGGWDSAYKETPGGRRAARTPER